MLLYLTWFSKFQLNSQFPPELTAWLIADFSFRAVSKAWFALQKEGRIRTELLSVGNTRSAETIVRFASPPLRPQWQFPVNYGGIHKYFLFFRSFKTSLLGIFETKYFMNWHTARKYIAKITDSIISGAFIAALRCRWKVARSPSPLSSIFAFFRTVSPSAINKLENILE